MSKDDLQTLGKTLGMSPDDAQSYIFNGAGSALANNVGPVGGNGLSNTLIDGLRTFFDFDFDFSKLAPRAGISPFFC